LFVEHDAAFRVLLTLIPDDAAMDAGAEAREPTVRGHAPPGADSRCVLWSPARAAARM